MEFKTAKLDTTAVVVSALTSAFMIALSVFFIIKVPIGLVFAAGLISIPLFSYLYAPRRYRFEGSKLVIEKVAGKRIVIELGDIKGCTMVPDFIALKPIRSFGNGGLFGYYGFFSTPDYGTINCQLTRLKNIFLIETVKGYYAISPGDTERFSEHLHSAVSGVTGKVPPVQPRPRAAVKPVSLVYLVIPDLIMVATVVMVILWYPYLPERLATHFDFRGVANGWSPKAAFPWLALIPAAVIFFFNNALFVILRTRHHDRHVLVFLVVLFSLIQAFLAFVNYDLCWFNTQGVHVVPIETAVILFFCLLGVCFLIYYSRVRKTSRS